ncbi:hypothetical protein TCAL_11131 [Tigriopus californicus]|uniref:WH1 domain-containing protein n=1 Tax=Tigriopus californicus TaxID=6832 RepID=A0A553NPH2_TIGCA|nr:actin nucleation-promoting factor WAS-like [Tigriopus californicus]TRY67325.1 hypothetical protein TCAL_11131 [Tigriopus californicus]|eukprot:TCALIF_11131-PA protein Name:"Similar to WAS Wiskott-Aldrich syndrome protein (Homo sapiens)" AED:0.03 eAED:0.03 QI:110/0.5/0.66/1/1/1/3/195/543
MPVNSTGIKGTFHLKLGLSLVTIMSAISRLLSDQENRMIKDFMEPTQHSLATTVAKLHLTSPVSRHKEWTTTAIGVVCYIKDRKARSYFIKFYDMTKRVCVWDQEVYRGMKYRAAHTWFHMFEAENSIAGIEFVDDNEATLFNQAIQLRLDRSKMVEIKKKESKLAYSDGLRQENMDPETLPHFKTQPPPLTYASKLNVESPPINTTKRKRKSKKKKKKGQEKSYTKEDISKPTGFVHVSGVKSSSEGFQMVDNSSEIDPRIQEFLKVAGLSEEYFKDPEQRREIESFVKTNNVIKTMDHRQSRIITKREAPKGPKPKPEIKIIHNLQLASPASQPPKQQTHYAPGYGTIPRARMSMTNRPQIPDMTAYSSSSAVTPPSVAPITHRSQTNTSKAPAPPTPVRAPPVRAPPVRAIPVPASSAPASSASPPLAPATLPPPAPPNGIKPSTQHSTRNLIAPENGRGDLMAEIRKRGGAGTAGLNKVSERAKHEKSPIRGEDNSLTAILKNALTSIQAANLGSSCEDSNDDDDEYNSGSWSDSETSC